MTRITTDPIGLQPTAKKIFDSESWKKKMWLDRREKKIFRHDILKKKNYSSTSPI
jgi:hypothetical protein